jgi:hypothetical protein
MHRQLRIGSSLYEPANSLESRSGEPVGPVTTRHKLLTSSWTVDVETLGKAVGRFTGDRPAANHCQVVFFESPVDSQLHVNVTHQHPTIAVRGWAGPARLPDGFLHKRRFDDGPRLQIIRHIRDMVFAESLGESVVR